MAELGLECTIVDSENYARAVAHLREHHIVLPRFTELAEPSSIPRGVLSALDGVGPDDVDPLNLFRVTWYNGPYRRSQVAVPAHLVLSEALTGVPAKIVVALGNRFPMIGAHKVLAAYGCLVPRIITGQFDPTRHRAVWPSTGNYCRGGIAISRIIRCRGVAVLPEGMSTERFDWLENWVTDPSDIVRTPGSESNVKEIYDKCAELERQQENVIFNQFNEFGNYLVHYLCTGKALEHIFENLSRSHDGLNLAAFVAATGSAGTLAAGDYLKPRYGTQIVAVEALECPTLLYNGYGEHNIQGIGDKHVPLIHNVMNTDVITAVSDTATDCLDLLFNTDAGRRYLVERRGVDSTLVGGLEALGLSSICNVLAAIKLAKYLDLGPDDAVVTVATDSAVLYESERRAALARCFPNGFDEVAAGEIFGQHLAGAATDHLVEIGHRERERIFNLGYFTWVEQQGVPLSAFDARRRQTFWRDLHEMIPQWDQLIDDFNDQTGVSTAR
jgi:cysteine synthase